MSDPFDVLRLPDAPLAPDPDFTARLRARLAAALEQSTTPNATALPEGRRPEGATMSATELTAAETTTNVVGRRPTLSAYLAVADARRAVEWYAEVFGGQLGESVEMPDGRLGHAEVHIGNATLMLADEFPEMDLTGPLSRGGTTVSVVVDVVDVDGTTRRAAAAGATVEREPADMPYGFRASAVVDPFGHRWLIEAPLAAGASNDASGSAAEPPARSHDEEPVTQPGDIAYVTWRVRDEQKTAAFFGELLGWTFSPGNVEHGLQVHGPNILGGLWGGGDEAEVDAKLMYHVADVTEAVAKVRALGGTATDPELQPYGWSSDCTDDQGMEFWIYTPVES